MTKPKIDLTDPAVAEGIKVYRERATLAYELGAAGDDAVRPVYALNERTQSVEHVGSCVLLKVQGRFFALSASHVFDNVGKYQLLFPHGNRLRSFPGDRFSSARGPSGTHQDDPIDASVFHITSDVPKDIALSFLTLQDLDLTAPDRNLDFYVATGYRISQSKSTNKEHRTKVDCYPSVELDQEHYEHFKLSREMHLLLTFEDQVLFDGKWQTSPSIRGFSGGAIFRIPNSSPLPSATTSGIGKIKLAAILIERRKGKRNRFYAAAVGTRIGFHLRLIHRHLPELQLSELLIAEQARQTSAPT